jgi:hypothetical protein
MNRNHRIVWSAVRGAYVVAHGKVASCGKPSSVSRAGRTAILLGCLLTAVSPAPTLAAPAADTLPTGHHIVGDASAQVDVGSLVATTMKLSERHFMAGNYTFIEGILCH